MERRLRPPSLFFTETAAVKVESIGRRNTSKMEVDARVGKRQAAVRLYRGKFRHLADRRRPGVKIGCAFWQAIAQGLRSEDAAIGIAASPAVGTRWSRHAGGVGPHLSPSVSGRYLSFAEREDIAIWRAQDVGVREIARRLGPSPSTISREVRRNASTRTYTLEYRASLAQWHPERRARRPTTAKPAANELLAQYVRDRLAGLIHHGGGAMAAGPAVAVRKGRNKPRVRTADGPAPGARNRSRLGRRWNSPDDESMRISLEAIYQALYLQGLGGLKCELVTCLRTGRALPGYDRRVLATERRQLIMDQIHRLGKVVTSEFAATLGFSDVTIRADLDELERRGRVMRTHGGAVATDETSNQAIIGFGLRMSMHRAEKRRIAVAAAQYLKSNQTVIFDAGTTVHNLAFALPDVENLTIYTPGISVAQHLSGSHGVEMHLLGGRVDPRWLETVGTPREQGLEDLVAHTIFLGAHGIDDDMDIVDLSRSLTQYKLELVRHARKVILLVDFSKWGQAGSSKVMPLERVDIVVTDNGISDEFRKRLNKCDVELIVV